MRPSFSRFLLAILPCFLTTFSLYNPLPSPPPQVHRAAYNETFSHFQLAIKVRAGGPSLR